MEIIEKDEEEKADGGEEVKKPKKIKKADGQIHVFKLKRGGKKILSVIKGMEYYSKDLKAMSSKFGKHFSCGCNVATDDIYGEHIQVQGDIEDKLEMYLENDKDMQKLNIDLNKIMFEDKGNKKGRKKN